MRPMLRTLERSQWFSGLSAALRQEIVARSVVRRFPARSLVYTAGSPPSGFFVVLAGEVRLEHMARSGKFAFYHVLRAGDQFGLLSEFDGSQRFSDARVWSDATLLHLPHAECQHLIRHDATALQAFVALLCRQLHVTLDMLVEEHSIPPRRQIANILLTLLCGTDDERGGSHRLTHEAVAAMAGVSRPTVSKVLHEFRSIGVIAMRYGRIAPVDAARLREIAQGRA